MEIIKSGFKLITYLIFRFTAFIYLKKIILNIRKISDKIRKNDMMIL